MNRIMNLHASGLLYMDDCLSLNPLKLAQLFVLPSFCVSSHINFAEWSGEIRSVSYSPDGKSVSVVYRVTLYGTDAEVHIIWVYY